MIYNNNTTCSNFECPKYSTCTYNIYDSKESICKDYLSRKQSIYKHYVEKCKNESKEPLSPNAYFNC